MQNQTKKILASALFAVLGLGMLWAVGQSQATPSSTTNNITIKDIERNQSSKLKTLFLAEEKAGQTNTNPSSIEKVRLVIDGEGSLNTFATSRLLDDSQERQSSNEESKGSVVGGIRNRNTQETSIIIGWEENSIEGNQGFIGGGSTNTVIKANSSVLGSSEVNLEGANTFAIGSNKVNIFADNATAIAGKNISIAKTAEGSLAIGNQITIATPGTFAFNTKSEKLSPQIEHSFVVNTDYGVLVNKHKSVDPKIQLNVGGAIRVGEVAKSSTIPALVQKSHGGSYSCVCFGTTAITQTDACQQICSGQNPNIKPKCGPNAKAYGKDDNNWAAGTDEPSFCEKGRLDTNFQKLYPQPWDQVSWKCKGINQPDITCEATRYFCGDGKKQTGEQCDAGVLNGDPQSNCSTTCKTVAAPACGSNASAYTHTATTWKNQTAKGFCSEGTIKGTQPPFFTPAPITLPTAPSCNKCGLKGFPYCFDVSFDPNSEACRDTNTPITGETHKNWTCKNANNAEVHCEATRPLPKPGECGTAHNVLKDSLTSTSSELCKQWTVSDFGEDTTKFTNRWSWKCQGTANTPAASCTAHKPQPQAGQCGTTLNSCNAGTPETNSTLTNGTRWICKGANQGEDTVCNVCNHNYTYNQDTNTCIPKTEQVQCAKTWAPANASYVAGTVNVTWNGTGRSTPANCAWTCNSGYTQQGNSCIKDAPVCDTTNWFSLHNGHCAKWSCDTGTTTTVGRCEGNYTWDQGQCRGVWPYKHRCSSSNMTRAWCNSICINREGNVWSCPVNDDPGNFETLPNEWPWYDQSIRICTRTPKTCSAFNNQATCWTAQGCTRKPGTSSTTQGHVCYREGETSPVAEHYCSGLVKPSCGTTIPSAPTCENNSILTTYTQVGKTFKCVQSPSPSCVPKTTSLRVEFAGHGCAECPFWSIQKHGARGWKGLKRWSECDNLTPFAVYGRNRNSLSCKGSSYRTMNGGRVIWSEQQRSWYRNMDIETFIRDCKK